MQKTLGLEDLVANRTMNGEVATALRDAARARRSFVVLAVPRLAGKSTVLSAMLAERPRTAPVRTLGADTDDIGDLLVGASNGYIVVPEITPSAAMPGYIWGAPVRRVFTAIGARTALAATLHAEGPEDAFAQICRGCGVPDGDAEKVSLAVSLRSLGTWERPTRRVVASVHEVTGVRAGRPALRELFRWNEAEDRYVRAR